MDGTLLIGPTLGDEMLKVENGLRSLVARPELWTWAKVAVFVFLSLWSPVFLSHCYVISCVVLLFDLNTVGAYLASGLLDLLLLAQASPAGLLEARPFSLFIRVKLHLKLH